MIRLEPGQSFVANVSLHVGGTVSGRVTDAATGVPLSSEEVRVDGGPSAITAADGTYSIRGLHPQSYRLSIAEVDGDGYGVPNPAHANEWWNGKRTAKSADGRSRRHTNRPGLTRGAESSVDSGALAEREHVVQ